MPSQNPPTLSTLPIELLTHICLQLDRKSALFLARVARIFTSPADHRIYRDLDLFLPPSYGEYPLVQPYERSHEGDYLVWAHGEAKRAEERHRVGLKAKVQEIMVESGGRRLGMVEKVTMMSRPGAINTILALLEVISPTLKSLEIVAPSPHVFENTWRPTDFETLDVMLLSLIPGGISFPSLTAIHIHDHSLRYAETVLLIAQMCPNLVSLTADTNQSLVIPHWSDDEIVPPLPDQKAILLLPKLRHLYLSFCDRDDEEDSCVHPFFQIISSCPLHERCSVQFENNQPCGISRVVLELSRKRHLTDLKLDRTLREFTNELEGGFGALRRLVLDVSESASEILEFLPKLPVLEAIYLENRFTNVTSPVPNVAGNFPEPPSNPTMLPRFALALRGSPRLASISFRLYRDPLSHIFDELDVLGTLDGQIGIIRSFVHADQELLHARLFVDEEEVADSPERSEGFNFINYQGEDGSNRFKMYQTQEKGQWTEMTEFQGHQVPVEIIRKMRQVEGVTEAAWQGRRVEIGTKAWKVLTDWRDAQEGEARSRRELLSIR